MRKFINFIKWLFRKDKEDEVVIQNDNVNDNANDNADDNANDSANDNNEPVKIPEPIKTNGVINGEPIPVGHYFPDVSRYRKMDYEKFTGKHLITKATEGDGLVDTTLKINADECKKRGIQFYVYHFYRWDIDPIKQAKHFLNTIKDYDVYTPLIVDYESSYKQTHEHLINDLNDLKLFIKHVNEATNSKMIIYSGESLLNDLPFDSEFLEICDSPWVANYSKRPKRFGPWKGMWAWQFSSSYKLVGIDHKEGGDANEFFGA